MRIIVSACILAADKSELACTYAALILHDDGIAVTADKISSLLTAAKVEVEPYWPGLFERALKGRNIDDLLLSVGGMKTRVCDLSEKWRACFPGPPSSPAFPFRTSS